MTLHKYRVPLPSALPQTGHFLFLQFKTMKNTDRIATRAGKLECNKDTQQPVPLTNGIAPLPTGNHSHWCTSCDGQVPNAGNIKSWHNIQTDYYTHRTGTKGLQEHPSVNPCCNVWLSLALRQIARQYHCHALYPPILVPCWISLGFTLGFETPGWKDLYQSNTMSNKYNHPPTKNKHIHTCV